MGGEREGRGRGKGREGKGKDPLVLAYTPWYEILDKTLGDVITRKFVGDASLNNDSFIHCVIYWLLQIRQICSFLWTRKNKKAFSFRGGGFAPLILWVHHRPGDWWHCSPHSEACFMLSLQQFTSRNDRCEQILTHDQSVSARYPQGPLSPRLINAFEGWVNKKIVPRNFLPIILLTLSVIVWNVQSS